MSILESLVLGIVQGLTEFIPISSKTHLIIIPALLHWRDPPVPFDVMLHAGTLLAALFYFRREFLEALEGIDRPSPGRRLVALLIIGTIPAALVGFLFERKLDPLFHKPALGALMLLITGVILFATETFFRTRPRDEAIESSLLSNVEKIAAEVTWKKSAFIGTAQIAALLPGVSRAGTTIGAGLLSGLSRPQAARFSFMLSIPLIGGTAIAEIPKLSGSSIGIVPILIGFFASLISGYFAIAGMIGYLQKRGLYPFAAYCLVVGPMVWLVLR